MKFSCPLLMAGCGGEREPIRIDLGGVGYRRDKGGIEGQSGIQAH